MKYDWSDKVLRAAAVEWAAREIGMPPPRCESGYSAWLAAAAGAAAALDLPSGAARLEAMMRDPMLRPEVQRVMSDIEGDETRIAQAEAPRDLLNDLLGGDDGVLGEVERMELAQALEEGRPIDRAQRLAMAVLLRGSTFAEKGQILRKFIEFLMPEVEGMARRKVWCVRDGEMAVPEDAAWRHVPSHVAIPGFPSLGRKNLVVMSGERIIAMRIFASYNCERSRNGSGRYFRYYQLVPSEELFSPMTCRRLAIIESLAHAGRPGGEGKRLARLFGVTPAAVHYQRKDVVEQIQSATGSRVGFEGMRNKPQINKGKPKRTP